MEKESNKYQQEIDFRRCQFFFKTDPIAYSWKTGFSTKFHCNVHRKVSPSAKTIASAKRRSHTDSTHILSCSTGKEIAIARVRNRSHKALQNQESVNSAQRGFSVFTKLKAHYWERVSLRCFPGNMFFFFF